MTVLFMYKFRSSANKLPKIFRSLTFPHFTRQVWLFFVEKGKPKTFGFKNVMERGIGKILSFVICYIASKIFGKILLKPL